MPAPGTLAAAERLHAEGREREALSLLHGAIRDDPESPPAIFDLAARCHDALGESADAAAARAARDRAVDRLRAARGAREADENAQRASAAEQSLRSVGARPVGELTPPTGHGMTEGKSGWLLVAGKVGLKATPLFLKAAPIVLKVGLAGLSLGAYSLLFDWRVALAILAMIGIHESGHVAAMKRYGVPTSGFYFLPFLGGVALAKKHPPSHKAWAVIVLAGPAVGATLSLIALAGWLATGEAWMAVLAIVNALLNLVNLLPIYPLDGGQLVKILATTSSTRLALGFAIVSGALSLAAIFGGFLLFGILGLLSLGGLWREAKLRHRVAAGEVLGWELAPTDLDDRGRTWIAAAYLGLAAALLGLVVALEVFADLPGASEWL